MPRIYKERVYSNKNVTKTRLTEEQRLLARSFLRANGSNVTKAQVRVFCEERNQDFKKLGKHIWDIVDKMAKGK